MTKSNLIPYNSHY